MPPPKNANRSRTPPERPWMSEPGRLAGRRAHQPSGAVNPPKSRSRERRQLRRSDHRDQDFDHSGLLNAPGLSDRPVIVRYLGSTSTTRSQEQNKLTSERLGRSGPTPPSLDRQLRA